MNDRRRPRAEAALAARLSLDGRSFHAAVATSIGAGGLFLRTSIVAPERSRVWVEVGLGPEIAPLRSPATVVYVNRVSGSERTPGLGLAIETRDESDAERIERFLDGYPGALGLCRDGLLAWPFGADAASDEREAEPERHGGVELLPLPGGAVRLGFEGRTLAPRSGVARTWLDEQRGAAPFAAAIDAQLAALGLLDEAGGRIEALEDTSRGTLERALSEVREARARCHDAAADPTYAELARNLASLEDFLGRLSWATATPDSEHAHDAALEAFRAEQAGRAAALPPTEETRRVRRRARERDPDRRRQLSSMALAALLVTLPVAIGVGVAAHRYAAERERWAPRPSPLLAELHGHAEGDVYHVDLDAWTSFDDRRELSRLMGLTTALAESGYNAAVFRHGSDVVAIWEGGALRPGSARAVH